MATVEQLQQRVAELEKERDEWKARAESALATPATMFPTKDRAWMSGAPVEYPQFDADNVKESFVGLLDFLIDDLVRECAEGYEMPERELRWVKRMLQHNVAGGKMNRGLMAIESGKALFAAKGMALDNTALCRFAVIGWCIEFLQAWLLIADDIMDDSQTRRGKPCWYKHEDVGLIAINDALLLESLTYKLLKRHLGTQPYYAQLVDLMHETTFQTEVGQLLDTICVNLSLSDFTPTRWELIVKYKTAFYSFYLAVAAGMIMAGVTAQAEYDRARELLVIMGVYFQAQDDYLDCYGLPEDIGKIGTDIQDKKCGWLFVHAFHNLASPEQKAYFEAHYGKCKVGSAEEKQIKAIYTELGLPELYAKYEQESYDKLLALKTDDGEVPWAVYDMFLKKIYKRMK